MNKVFIIGHLGQDPEIKMYNGTAVGRLSIATSRKYKDAKGVVHEETEWHRVVVWGALADFALSYCPKGRQVCVEGRLKYGSYEKDGQKHYTAEIVADHLTGLGPSPTPNKNRPQNQGSQNRPQNQGGSAGYQGGGEWQPPEGYEPDDNLKF